MTPIVSVVRGCSLAFSRITERLGLGARISERATPEASAVRRRRASAGVAAVGGVLLGSCATAPSSNVLEPLPVDVSVPAAPPSSLVGDVADRTFAVFVADCMEFVPFKAYTGDPAAQALWTRAGQSTATLTIECQVIAANPDAREALQSQMTQLDQFFASAALTDSTTTTDALLPPES